MTDRPAPGHAPARGSSKFPDFTVHKLFGEVVLDQVAPSVHVRVIGELLLSVGLRWDHSTGAALVQFRAQPVSIEGLVAQKGIEAKVMDQGLDTNHVMALTGQQHETDQVSQGVHQGDDLGGQASSRSPDGLILSPPLAPLAFW